MAKQIADFFRAYPEAEAQAGIRNHILSFWTPAMRAAILRAGPEAAVDPLVAAALKQMHGHGIPPPIGVVSH